MDQHNLIKPVCLKIDLNHIGLNKRLLIYQVLAHGIIGNILATSYVSAILFSTLPPDSSADRQTLRSSISGRSLLCFISQAPLGRHIALWSGPKNPPLEYSNSIDSSCLTSFYSLTVLRDNIFKLRKIATSSAQHASTIYPLCRTSTSKDLDIIKNIILQPSI